MQFDPASKKLRIDAAELCHTVVNHASIDRRAAPFVQCFPKCRRDPSELPLHHTRHRATSFMCRTLPVPCTRSSMAAIR